MEDIDCKYLIARRKVLEELSPELTDELYLKIERAIDLYIDEVMDCEHGDILNTSHTPM